MVAKSNLTLKIEVEQYIPKQYITNSMDIIDDLLIRFDYNNEYIIPRRVIFVVDRSGSMNKIKWNKTL